MKQIQIQVLISCGLILGGLGCTKPGASDDAISNDLKAKLAADPTVKSTPINVAVQNGAVTLSGDVPTSDVELAAMKVANSTSGVRGVNDQLKVNTAMAAPGELPTAGSPAAASQPAPVAPPSVATTPAPAPSPAPAAIPRAPVERPAEVSIPAGTAVSVSLIDAIDTAQNTAGQTFHASLASPLTVRDRVIVPVGNNATVLLTGAKGAGRIKGNSAADVRLASIEYRGKVYPVESSSVQQTGKARGKNTAIKTGIGAAAGALIGGLAGGGKGAAIGSAAGGGAGFGLNAFTHGAQVKIPSETVLNFTLQAPLTLTRER